MDGGRAGPDARPGAAGAGQLQGPLPGEAKMQHEHKSQLKQT